MRIAILDPFAGISGDMLLGALLDAGVEAKWLEGLPQRLGLSGVTVSIQRVERCAVSATKVDFHVTAHQEGGHHGRHVAELVRIIEQAPLSAETRKRAVEVFRAVGEAEGRVHGVAPERVHLHEVGAIDALLDIVGAVEGLEQLGVEAVYHLPVAVGHGWVEAAHGRLPVPAPATSYLLEGIEVRSGGPVEGEATTPTGAALLRVLSQGSPPDRWRPLQIGWGAGTRDPGTYPNVLRLVVAEGVAEASTVRILATDIDDLSPEYLEPMRAAVLEAGALDCVVWPTQGKKGRLSVRVEAQAPTERVEAVSAALFAHSTTAGIRQWEAARSTLPRRSLVVELAGAPGVRIKVLRGPGGERFKAEYDDVLAAARVLGRPALDVAREAELRAAALLGNGQDADG